MNLDELKDDMSEVIYTGRLRLGSDEMVGALLPLVDRYADAKTAAELDRLAAKIRVGYGEPRDPVRFICSEEIRARAAELRGA